MSGGQQAIFRVNVTLAIPNIDVFPALEELQQALNRAVDCVVSVSKGVGQWSKERISKVGLVFKAQEAIPCDSTLEFTRVDIIQDIT